MSEKKRQCNIFSTYLNKPHLLVQMVQTFGWILKKWLSLKLKVHPCTLGHVSCETVLWKEVKPFWVYKMQERKSNSFVISDSDPRVI